MNNKLYLNDIYNDFFGKNSTEEIIFKTEDNDKIITDIDNLYIDDNSKKLFKKILLYMEKYSKSEEKNYINFNIVIETNNKENTYEIINILKECITKYNYIDNNSSINLSLYKLDDINYINNYYVNSGIINIEDIKEFNTYDVNDQKKFIYLLKENLNNKKITIISGTQDVLKEFFLNDDSLENNYFCFKITTINPSSNDIYLNILERIKDINSEEEFNIKLLDYIVETYDKSNLDYVTYIDNLCKYIAFNKELPKIEKIKSTTEIFKDLNELVGLNKVKKVLNELVDLITLKDKVDKDIKINNVNLHMVFLGNPGTGKTTVARMICEILYDLKYIKQNKLIEISPKDLIAEYVGQTGPKTTEVINRAMNGILFIDEAYTLGDTNNSYSSEAIATLIKAMEDNRDKLVIIFAGYTKEMQSFLNSNSGIRSRIGYTLEFDDYTDLELEQIFINMISKSGFILDNDALVKFREIIKVHRNDLNFGNARFVRNVYEKTILKHASNTKNKKNKTILKTIKVDDINC